ncbi:hypothetical protein BKA67DRAFT_511428 [Truncatella angustata]|uniref:FAD-binding PCMH-type domain-containing protein n=1 Tax=Truncatella angustata TaxID=152316 RepID=A0A9P8UUV0_9PEZI|nr:uncharacterized protein BKA67DRAFT_511428 [Truncatella angustata]KAH6658931.1 hypothetical protein BKA67DRAFT_511428 [Truncatella angustata]KAH8196234.1 hypothetical protein TruAng_009591 [Truncatella angustata]
MPYTRSFAECLVVALGGISSSVLLQGQANYTAAVKPYNLDIAVTPAAIVFPETAAQVAGVVKCAVNAGIKVQPRCGGHNYGNFGSSTGELSVHLDKLRSFSFEEATGRATVGGGMLLGELNENLWNAGQRYLPHGLSFSIGVGGHATVGGVGITSRPAGLLTDHIVESEVVLANGSIVRASEKKNRDLFFAIRGAGGSFGVVTKFIFQSDPAPTSIINYSFAWVTSDAATRARLLKDWQKWIRDVPIPAELSSTLTIAPSVILVAGGFLGTLQQFKALNLTTHFPPPQQTTADVYTSYRNLSTVWSSQMLESGIALPSSFYAKSLLFNNETFIPDTAVDQFFNYLSAADTGADFWVINFELGGGKIGALPSTATAFPHRDAVFAMLNQGTTTGAVSQTLVKFLNRLSKIVTDSHPGAAYGGYAGYVDPREDNDEARTRYWGTNLARLRAVKKVVDPNDVFHNQQSVPPAGRRP